MVNDTSLPVKATIWGTKPSTGTQNVTIGGSSAFKGTIYAPNANLTLGGSGGVYGAVIAKTVAVSGSGDIHYDIQLATATSAGGPTPSSGGAGNGYLRVSSWSELSALPGSGHPFARDNRTPFNTLF